jgi:FG-GAP-like repeat
MRSACVCWLIIQIVVAGDSTAQRRRAVSHPPSFPHLYASSYENYKEIGLVPQTLPSGDNTVRAYGDFTGHARLDLFRAVLTYNTNLPISQATPSRFEFYARQRDGSYMLATGLLAETNGCIHPRKAIVADFNNDGRPDVFVACHGYDAPPFPGERSKVVLSQPDGTYVISDASSDVAFNHGATAADLNGDGLIDVIVAAASDPNRAYVLLNDGSGHFIRETTSRLPTSIRNGNYYSVELVDLNQDGKLDLLLGGHEFEGAPTVAFINPGSNNFAAAAPIVLPAVMSEGVVLDFTVTGDDESRTLWILRTSGGDGTFYQSRVLQRVAYPSLASSVVVNERPARWIPWVIPAVVGGVNVITSDDAADGLSAPQ